MKRLPSSVFAPRLVGHVSSPAASLVGAVLVGLLLAACGSDAAEPSGLADTPREAPAPSPPAPTPAPDPARPFVFDGAFARAASALPSGERLVLLERPVRTIERWGRPLRAIVWTSADGTIRAGREATTGRELLDVAVHPSGALTILEASSEGFSLLRLDASGALRGETHVVDPAILADQPTLRPHESRAPIEEVTHDVGRLVPDGEGVFLATRTGRHSVIAYRAGFDEERAAFAITARTLVVPAHELTATGLTGGSYDTFGQLDAHFGVFVALGADGTGFVAIGHQRIELGDMVEAHAKVFGETLVTDPDWLDAFVTRVAPSGQRLGTSVVGTPDDEQLYGLHADGDGVIAVGRTERWNAEGTGFDAFHARIDASGAVTIATFDVDRGDIAFDARRAPSGDLVVVGASGYVQNPHGASISEESHTFVRTIAPDGTVTAVPVPDGPRHSEVRFALPVAGGFVFGGMLDGPGTHSADGDSALLRARPFYAFREHTLRIAPIPSVPPDRLGGR